MQWAKLMPRARAINDYDERRRRPTRAEYKAVLTWARGGLSERSIARAAGRRVNMSQLAGRVLAFAVREGWLVEAPCSLPQSKQRSTAR